MTSDASGALAGKVLNWPITDYCLAQMIAKVLLGKTSVTITEMPVHTKEDCKLVSNVLARAVIRGGEMQSNI